MKTKPKPVWLFDLDDTLHDATGAAFGEMHQAIGDYVVRHLGITSDEADALRRRYWQRYGATLLGLVRHHGVSAAHFLEETHRMPGLEERLRTSAHDRAALKRLPGRKLILTNAPRAYALRVLDALGLTKLFDGVISIDEMTMFGDLRPKPDARMLRRIAALLRVPTHALRPGRGHPAAPQVGALARHAHGLDAALSGRALSWHGARRAQRRLARGCNSAVEEGPKPPYVCARIASLRKLAPAQ